MIRDAFIHNTGRATGFRIIKYSSRDPAEFKGAICIIGMPGIADVGKFAIDQLIGLLNAERFYEIIFYDYPAGAIIDESILSTPKAEILTYKNNGGGSDIILVTADAQALTPRGIYEISDLLAELIAGFGVKEIISLGGLPSKNRDKSNLAVYISKTEEFDLESVDPSGLCKRIGKGVIVGSCGLIPTLAKIRFNISGTVLLTEIDPNGVEENGTDLKASVLLLETAARLFGLPIRGIFDINKVDELTKDLEIKKKRLEKELENFAPIETEVKEDKTIYI